MVTKATTRADRPADCRITARRERDDQHQFVGWRRLARGRWQAVVRAGDAAECLDRLLDHARASGRSGESVVLPAGRSPAGGEAGRPAQPAEGR
jgi:hypothetical protein